MRNLKEDLKLHQLDYLVGLVKKDMDWYDELPAECLDLKEKTYREGIMIVLERKRKKILGPEYEITPSKEKGIYQQIERDRKKFEEKRKRDEEYYEKYCVY